MMGRRKETCVIRLTRNESEGLMRAGNAGVADLIDAQDEESLDHADWADAALNKLGMAMAKAWPVVD